MGGSLPLVDSCFSSAKPTLLTPAIAQIRSRAALRLGRMKGAVQVDETPIGVGADRHSYLTAVVWRQDASTADLMRGANAGASLTAALAAKPTMSLPKPWPSKVLRIVTFV